MSRGRCSTMRGRSKVFGIRLRVKNPSLKHPFQTQGGGSSTQTWALTRALQELKNIDGGIPGRSIDNLIGYVICACTKSHQCTAHI